MVVFGREVVSDSSATPWTVACQASLSMDFPSKNTGVGSHFLLQGDRPNPGNEPEAPVTPAGDPGSIPGSGRSPGEGNGNPLQCSLPRESQGQRSLEGCRLWGRTESDTTDATRQQQQQPCLPFPSSKLLLIQSFYYVNEEHCSKF